MRRPSKIRHCRGAARWRDWRLSSSPRRKTAPRIGEGDYPGGGGSPEGRGHEENLSFSFLRRSVAGHL
eukprot:16001973-Heterocapsa_arctica.AAC.1